MVMVEDGMQTFDLLFRVSIGKHDVVLQIYTSLLLVVSRLR